MSDSTRAPGRGWGYAGAILGGLVSIAANVAHSFIAPAGASPSWHPPIGDVLGSVFWPVALFVAIEILTRTAWPEGPLWWIVRVGGLLPVTAVAALVSYEHLSGLLASYHESSQIAHIGPLAVDGLMVMASAALMATAQPHAVAPAVEVVETEEAAPAVAPQIISAPPAPQAPAFQVPTEPMNTKAKVSEYLAAHPALAAMTPTKIHQKLEELCNAANVTAPSYPTVYRVVSGKP